MKSPEPDPLSDAYAAAWATRIDQADDSLQILYVAMHDADLDRFLDHPNPILDFIGSRWEAGTPPERFTRDLRRNALVLYARVVKNAVTTTAGAVRTIWQGREPSPAWSETPEFGPIMGSGYSKADVDPFVVRVQAALRAPFAPGSITPQEIVDKRFESAEGRTGYPEGEVDQWLDEAEHQLRLRRS